MGMDLRRFSTIAHANHSFASPITRDRALHLLRIAGVGPGTTVLDIGCGFGGWAALACNAGARVTAVDPNAAFLARGREGAPDVNWIEAEYAPELIEDGSQDVVLCIGSTHALGGMDGILAESSRVLVRGGAVLLGEGFWRCDPDVAYLKVLGAEPDEMVSHAANAKRITGAAWSVVFSTTATQAEWDDYEGFYRKSMVQWLASNPADPEANVFRARSDGWYRAYLETGRVTLGFGYYVAVR